MSMKMQKNEKTAFTLKPVYSRHKIVESCDIAGLCDKNKEYISELKRKAEQGDADAQYNLGKLYYKGDGIRKNVIEAAYWYSKAADQGNSKAQCALGHYHYYNGGRDVVDYIPCHDEYGQYYDREVREYECALYWFEKAAKQGDEDAQLMLGVINEDHRNYEKALHWYQIVAAKGNPSVQFYVGRFYANGKGCTASSVEAFFWYSQAAEQGNADAQHELGKYYECGRGGVPQDNAEAVKWYRMAAEQGNASAQYDLGRCYEHGYGIPQDNAEAVKWYRMAAEHGNADAQSNLDRCYKEGKVV